MYSEFIELSGKSDRYISNSEYLTFIKPLYLQCDIDKYDFVTLLNVVFERVVYPIIDHEIDILLSTGNMDGAVSQTMDYLQAIDFEARKLAYQCISLYSKSQGKYKIPA